MLDLVVSMLIIDKLRGYYNTYGSLTVSETRNRLRYIYILPRDCLDEYTYDR